MLTIWCNSQFSGSALDLLKSGLESHRLLFSSKLSSSNLAAGVPDPTLAEADVAFGQPDPASAVQAPRLKWIQLTTAGYTRYDTDEFRTGLARKQAMLTNSSQVYDQPCAEHALAFMLAQARQLPQCLQAQEERSWESAAHRARSRLLAGQNVAILGFGAIARRLAHLLRPFNATVKAVRRKSASDEPGVEVIGLNELPAALRHADHVVNILPDNPDTRGFMTAERFAEMKRGAIFYNIGRGTTVDQEALLAALRSGQVGAAYLDVTNPEPLPHDHPLWSAPNCFITPHTAGGFDTEDDALVQHFLSNLSRFIAGEELKDRVI
ncbi:D-2-hydroxyacid dehydrogenase [Verrucomicrobiota bacterium sgz303538]